MTTVIGLILIFIGCFNIFQYNKVMEGNYYVNGTLVEFSYSPNARRSYPIFRYVVDGITYEEKYRGSNHNNEEIKNINIDEMPEKTKKFMKKLKDINFIDFQIGKEYKLLVNKENPKEYWLAEDGTNRGREYVWIIIGVIFLSISIIGKIFKIFIN